MTTARVLPPGPLQTERIDDGDGAGRRWLLRKLVVDLGVRIPELAGVEGVFDDTTTTITVPKGFDTDYSSVPFFARMLMGRWDRHDLAGVVHDWLYRVGAPRDAADAVWRLVARSGARHVGPVRGFLGWAGLRVGGWWAYSWGR